MASATPNKAPSLPSSFTPAPSRFQGVISSDPASEFPAEKNRYALYLHLGCSFAQRIFSFAFDEFLAPELREVNKPGGGLPPERLEKEIGELGGKINLDYNWGNL